eukprot:TRINITY_DN18435_c0_g1_i1.p1 TRINITY_DN18435_c0_g1~~TRINITY_DN18435_c0_g1_i1.p1  ORF type:complete len:526 (+),score=126.51 TRINITY_DN18435_c0_g1_i1:72-1649(+)
MEQQQEVLPESLLKGIDLDFSKQPLSGTFNQNGWADTSSASEVAQLSSFNPSTGQLICKTLSTTKSQYDETISSLSATYKVWAAVPAPKRGEILRQISDALRAHKQDLATILSHEVGKIPSEAAGEVQEFIDMCDYALGLSRSFSGSIFPSERPNHFLLENYHPLGIVAVITAFNFPIAVFGWNMCIALITGNVILWKGAPSTSLCTLSVMKIISKVFTQNNLPQNVVSCVSGEVEVGQWIVNDKRIDMVSFTGSTAVGRKVNVAVAERFGRVLLECGGNNSIIILDDADEQLAIRGVLFAAVGTCGQRCTTVRRLFVQEGIYDRFLSKLTEGYKQVKIGSVSGAEKDKVLCGPLHRPDSIKIYENALAAAAKQGGKTLVGGQVIERQKGWFVQPTIVEIGHDAEIVQEESFVPILWVVKVKTFEEAVRYNNEVSQGLSSSVFTRDVRKVFEWIGSSTGGSDCGIVNVNIPTSGAEIGGAFGGNKATGGGREAGADSWKQYTRRSTCTINYGNSLPLSQGINFGE